MKRRVWLLPILAFASLVFTGCGGSRIHPVKGYVIVEEGSLDPVIQGHVELASATDPSLRASGKIREDGRFEVQSQAEGQLRRGVPEGKYQVRFILPQGGDEDSPRPATRERVDPRLLKFESSGLEIDVPSKSEVAVPIRTTQR